MKKEVTLFIIMFIVIIFSLGLSVYAAVTDMHRRDRLVCWENDRVILDIETSQHIEFYDGAFHVGDTVYTVYTGVCRLERYDKRDRK